MKKYVCITIDTEVDHNTSWQKHKPLSYSSVLFGIPNLLRPLWNNFAVNPTYFITPEIAQNHDCCRILKQEIAKGAEVGSHLHTSSIKPHTATDENSSCYVCYSYPNEIELLKLQNLTDLIKINLGQRPTSFRAARFGADIDTINMLIQLGYKVDSSVTPGIDWSQQGGPDFSDFSNQPYLISTKNFQQKDFQSPILEIPITIGKKRLPFLPHKWYAYRWLRPTLTYALEQKMLINNLLKKQSGADNIILCLMFHSMEIIPGATPYVRTKLGQKLFLNRLESTLDYLSRHGFEFVTTSELHKIYV